MTAAWLSFEFIINFLEMATSCLLATRILRKEIERYKGIFHLLIFAVCGALLLLLREVQILPIPDYIPAMLIFTLYARFICHSKWWPSLLWSLINYLLIGINVIMISSILSIIWNSPVEMLSMRTDGRVLGCVLVRLGQLLLSELLSGIMKQFKKPFSIDYREISSLLVAGFSIVALMLFWYKDFHLTENIILYFNIFICVLILFINFAWLFFREILSKEQSNNKELTIQNQLISMQIRSQDEVSQMYQNLRALRHDMNNHLHAISGYLQLREYEKAENYISKIIDEIDSVELISSGNSAIDALLGNKTALARKDEIQVDIDLVLPSALNIPTEHLTTVLGNLYDNAIDANRKIENVKMRYINIEISFRDDNLMIQFENAAPEADQKPIGFWPTTKKDKFSHGFGIKNIDRIVQLYSGYCYRELHNNVFTCNIRIPNEKR